MSPTTGHGKLPHPSAAEVVRHEAPAGRRLAAWLIDLAAVALGLAVLGLALWAVALVLPAAPEQATTGGAGFLLLGAALVAAPTAALAYLVGFTAAGATPGKRLLGLRVVSCSGGPPYAGRAFGRLCVLALLGPLVLLGRLHGDRRGYHDRLAGTRVIRTHDEVAP